MIDIYKRHVAAPHFSEMSFYGHSRAVIFGDLRISYNEVFRRPFDLPRQILRSATDKLAPRRRFRVKRVINARSGGAKTQLGSATGTRRVKWRRKFRIFFAGCPNVSLVHGECRSFRTPFVVCSSSLS